MNICGLPSSRGDRRNAKRAEEIQIAVTAAVVAPPKTLLFFPSGLNAYLGSCAIFSSGLTSLSE